MSDTYTWPQRCPDLVQDVSLKRARIDDENNTSAIRTTISGVDADHPLPVSISAISENVDQSLPVLVKSDLTQWIIFGVEGSMPRFFRIQWYYLSPQILPQTTSPITDKWFTVIKANPEDTLSLIQELNGPPKYRFALFDSGSYFPGGWVASNSDYRNLTRNITLYAFKAGNTNFSSPDVKVYVDETFFWDGGDFTNCQEHFDSTALYLQKVGGTQGDAAWSGSGNGTVISLLKGIANIF